MFSNLFSLPGPHCICVTLVTIVLLCSPISNGQTTCTAKGNCACKFTDGSIIDISSLGNTNGKPRFGYSKPSPTLPWEFAFNPCYDFTDEHCTKVVSCQTNAVDPTQNFALGTADSATWASDGKSVTYSSTADGNTRTSELTLVCDPTATDPNFIAFGEDTSSQLYKYTLTSNCACPDGCKPGGGGGGSSGGLSVGSVICILFVVLVVVYLVVGSVYMKYGRGAEGKEIIPNSSFWLDFHNYVKDGFLFLTSLCKKSEYSDI